jgi:hypothetical protein
VIDNALLVLLADLHINSTCALCPPVVNLDKGTYHSTRTQHWLWECWLHFWDYVKDKANGKRIIVIFNGDLGELDTKRRSNQLISPNKSVILDLVKNTLEPALDVADIYIIIRGTAAHEGKDSWLEEDIAKDILAFPYSKTVKSWWHFTGKVSDVRFDIAHHARIGGRPFNKPSAATRLAADTMWHYSIEKKQPAPDITARSHGHVFADSGRNFETRAFYTPCWTMINEFGYRIGNENDKTDIGGLIFDCNGRNYTWEYQRYEPKEARQVWRINL